MSAYNCTFLFLEHVMSSYYITNFLLLCLWTDQFLNLSLWSKPLYWKGKCFSYSYNL